MFCTSYQKCPVKINMDLQKSYDVKANDQKRQEIASLEGKKFYVDIVYGKGWYDAGVSEKFDELSKLLLKRFSPNLVLKGEMVKKGGLFEIYLNGDKLFSKVRNIHWLAYIL